MRFSLKSAVGLFAFLALPADAFFRMPCGPNIVTERADPIISPGAVSGHVHQINGGNGFGFTLDYAGARKGTCTSCAAKADLSNYWTPILYYKDQQGKLTRVGQTGMTVYYEQRGTDTNIKAFPEGFRMIAGDPFKRNSTEDFASQAVSYACLDYNKPPTPQTPYLPRTSCPNGLRAQIYFPSCWDGVNLDSADHKSHMAYPSGHLDGGTCPSSHPVQLISIFFEVMFDAASHTFWDGDYGTQQPFVFAMGDPTGYAFHGDFLNGWDVPTLQNAINTCTSNSGTMEDCHALEIYTDAERAASTCSIPSSINEDIDGPFDNLPGCNPITAGPERAAPVTNCAVTSISGPQLTFTDVTALGWSYEGCASDDTNSRTLTGSNNVYSTNQATTDVESCIKSCLGSTYAGLEYGKQCFCGNSVAADRAPKTSSFGSCNLPCAGNSSQICGGNAQLSLYKVCPAGSSCKNTASYTSIGNLSGGGTGSGTSGGSASGSGSTAGNGSTAASGSLNGYGSGASAASTSSTSSSSSATPATNKAVGAKAQKAGSGHSAVKQSNPSTTLASSVKKGVAYVTTVSYVTTNVKVKATPTGKKAKKHRHGHKQ